MARIILFLGVLACFFLYSSAQDAPQVTIDTGIIEGLFVINGTGSSFLGVPYAAPPVGALRWKQPQAASSWDGVKQTIKFAHDCAQPNNGMANNPAEDCLYLNVYTPFGVDGITPDAKLPVMVWFYGGSWTYGGTSFFVYNGAWDAHLAKDVIVVTVNYRLGPFGFLGSSELAAESPDGSTGNFGIQDQRSALQWVSRNIQAFGGDPSRVTIFGQSAGSGSVANHLVMNQSKGLFQRAIMESGPFADWTAFPMSEAQEHFDAIVNSVGCAGSASLLDCMRNTSMEVLLDNRDDPPHYLLAWGPVIDGVELQDQPQKLAERGQVASKVPVLLGSNLNEGTTFIDLPVEASEQDYVDYVNGLYGPDLGATVLDFYPASDYRSPWWAMANVFTEAVMSCPARRSARWLTNLGVPVYLYFFTHQPTVSYLSSKPLGVFHGAEIPFVFDWKLLLIGEENEMASSFVCYWTSFASSGDPNSIPCPESTQSHTTWPQYALSSDQNIELGIPYITVQSHLKQVNCDLWDSVYETGCDLLVCPCNCTAGLSPSSPSSSSPSSSSSASDSSFFST